MKNVSAMSSFKICFCVALVVSLVNCTREHEKNKVVQSRGDIVAETTLLASIAKEEKPHAAPVWHEAPSARQSQSPSFQVIFSESGRGVAYAVEKVGKVSVVYNKSRGKEYSAVGAIVLSFDGRHIAYAAFVDGKWCMVVDGKEGRRYDTLLTPLFSPDSQHVAYQAKEHAKWYLVVDDTPNAGTLASYATPEFNAASTEIAFVEAATSSSEMKLIVSDLMFRTQNIKKSIGDLLFTTNKDKTRIAATQVVDNKLRVVDFSFAKPDVVHAGRLYDVIEKLTFGDDGVSVCYCALEGRKRLLVLDDREELLPKGLLPELPMVRPDKKGVGVLLTSKNRFFLHQSFFNSAEQGNKYDEAAGLAYSKDSRFYVYSARKGEYWFVVVNGKEGPAFDRVVTPMFTPDSKYLIYRARKDGKRFVVVADADGKTIKQHPVYEQVFQPVFTTEGKSVAYGVKDGNDLIWKVEKIE